MKKTITLLFALYQITVYAQSFWSVVLDSQSYNLDYNKSYLNDNALLGDSIIVVGGYVSVSSCPGQKIFAYDLSGNSLWAKSFGANALYSDSISIYSVGYNIGADDVGGDEFLNITRIDKSGNILFDKQISYGAWFYFMPNSIDLDQDKNILISSTDGIIKADSTGNFNYEKKFHFTSDITNISFISSKYFLINTSHTLYKSDSAGVLLDSIYFKNNSIKTLAYKDTIYQLSKNYLFILDTALNILDTIISSYDIELHDIITFDNTLWILGFEEHNVKLLKLNHINISDTLTFKTPLYLPHFLVSGENIIFSGTSPSGQIAVCHFNSNELNQEISYPDIEIADFDIDSIIIEYYDSQDFHFARGYRFNTEMSVHNKGIDTITSFAIFAALHGGFNCVQNYFYQKFSDVSILPDQTLTVKLNRIYEEGIINNIICFECLAPNSKIESDTGTNRLCKSFEITDIKNDNFNDKIKIYPNPAVSYLQIDFNNNENRSIRFTDILGKCLISENITKSKIKIELVPFKTGIYLLKITSKKGITTFKIMKN